MVERCLCYTTDTGYALPTLLSALQARASLSTRTDVVIILVGASRDEAGILSAVCEPARIVLQSVPRGSINDLPISFARHFLDCLLDARYRRVAHIDGDTQICGQLDPLLDVELGPGKILAVIDPMALLAGTSTRSWARRENYLAGIGITAEGAARYVNTGLFRVERSDLGAVGKDCRRLALAKGGRFAFGEQDAFNLVHGGMIDLASLRWNYPAFFSNFRYGHLVQPRVRHFMSNPRPWQGPFLPWGKDGFAPYIALVARHPDLARFHAPFRGWMAFRYAAQQRLKRLAEPMLWDRREVKLRIAALEKATVV